MTRILIAVLLLFAVSFAVQAQKPYSDEHLEKASVEELDMYYNKALKLQKTGRIFNIAGVSVIGASGLGIAAFGSSMGMAAIFFVFPIAAGIVSLAVGIPMNLTAKNRVARIDALRNTVFKDITIDLAPSSQYNYISCKSEPAITLRIRF